jgi:hypothetical protein
VLPEHRMVAEEADPWDHVREALTKAFPSRGGPGVAASRIGRPACCEALEGAIDMGDLLPAWRRGRARETERVGETLRSASDECIARMPARVRAMMGQSNLPSVAALCEEIENGPIIGRWPPPWR